MTYTELESKIGKQIESEWHQHKKGNGWVHKNATVDETVFISGIVFSGKVSGNAWVSGDAWVSGNAQVSENAQVSGNARVSGNAWVSWEASLLVTTGLGYTVTAHADAKLKVRWNVGCFSGTAKEFAAKAKAGKIPAPAIRALLALAKATIKKP